MSKIKNMKLGKRFLAGTLAAAVIGSGLVTYKLHRQYETNRVKDYLEDFRTEENYVDLSKISKDYNIKDFSGEILAIAMEEMDVAYVRLVDSYIYNDPHVLTFAQMTATNFNHPLGIDDTGNVVYEMYEPIRCVTEEGLTYAYPAGYILEKIDVIAEPIRYEDLKGSTITVENNDYDNSYRLELKRKWV